jgi:hypothetical protein
MSVYKNSIGIKLIAECGTDITAATTRQIKYRKPDGTSGAWTAVQETGTSISYTVVSGDIDFTGDLQIQAYVITPTWTLYGDVARLTVLDVL